jgi:cytochrome c553
LRSPRTIARKGTALALALAAVLTSQADDALDFFEKRVRPVLVDHCYRCHSADAPRVRGGLRLDSRAALLAGGDSGPALTPGDPDASLLLEAVRYTNVDLQMPPKGRLTDAAIADLADWVSQGAAWPETTLTMPHGPAEQPFNLEARRQTHWSWQPIARAPPPSVRNAAWVRQPTDAFLLARLETHGLRPAPPASPTTRVRRLWFDLVGLPPAPEVVAAFTADPSPSAWATLVDTLLASTHFGERWARHWLDLVRYAETLGHEFDYALPNAWRYRDYVIRAFNDDVPYDRFAREHVAGDLEDPPRLHPVEGFNESVIGTGFYWLGQRPHSPVDIKQHQADVLDDQIDVLTKTFLGLTVACARCHDHKFDALSTRDYYALYGILSSSRYSQPPLLPAEQVAPSLKELRDLRQALSDLPSPVVQASSLPPPPLLPSGETVLVDFATHDFTGWFTEGAAFGEGPIEPGHLLMLATNRLVVAQRRLAHSAATSRRLEGVLASPTFVITQRFAHVLAAGRSSRIKVPVENFTMIRDPIYGGLKRWLDHDEFRWVTFDLGPWQGRRAFLEFHDGRTPDLTDERGGTAESYLAIAKVVFADAATPPATGTEPDFLQWVDVLHDSPAAPLLARWQALEATFQDPPRAPGMIEGTGWDERVFVRGNPRNPGEVVPRRFLEALTGEAAAVETSGSGRRELARAITAPDNPFFARVFVNRVWLHLFGRGLVPTPDDFGVLGETPSHPELLDWLADWFRTEGQWSVKRLIRLLVTSNAYQMASQPSNRQAEELDPENRWWHRMPLRRLEGEAIRDAILAVSGRLDPTPFGPSVPIQLTEFMDGRGRPARSGPVDGDGRRSIYLEVRRNFLSPLMRTFDTPVPFTTVGRRTVSNVPAQSLILLNDPFVQGEAARWARQLLAEGLPSNTERLDRLYRRAFGRAPTETEQHQARAFLDSQAAWYHAHPETAGDASPETQVWADLCHVLFNVKEFIYLD